ncbi:MAG: autotransporter-associated beta strand repeat-containing protein [Verrucomicrobiota bacterium]
MLDVVLTGTAPLEKTDSGTLVLTGANTFTAPTNVSAGTIVVSDLGNGTTASPLGITDLADPSKLVLAGAGGVKPVLEFTGIGGASTARSFTVGGDGAGIAAGTGAGALVFTSAAKINLTNANAEFKLVANNAAENRFEAELASGSPGLKNITIDGTGQWVIAGPANRFAGDFRLDVAGGTLKFKSGALGDATNHSGSQIVISNGATLAWDAGNIQDISSRLKIEAGTTAKLQLDGNVTFASAPAVVDGASATIEKKGSGTLTFNGTSSALDVNLTSGRLVVNGTVGDVTVASGTVLGGTGTVGTVGVGSGGTFAPGNSPGLLTLTSLELDGGSFYDFEVSNATAAAGTGYDSFITQTLDLRGASVGEKITIKVISMESTVAGTIPANFSSETIRSFTFGTYGEILLPTGVSNINDIFTIDVSQFLYSEGTASNAGLWSLSYDSGTNGSLTLTAVPEPSTYGFALGALALAAAAVRRRRKQAQAKA